MITRRTCLTALGLVIAAPATAASQRPPGPRVVLLGSALPEDQMRAFEDQLRALQQAGSAEVVVERLSAGEREDALPMLARDAVARAPRVIVAVGTKAALSARQATKTIPIVTVSGDVVAAGIVKNLGRPEANVTGLSFLTVDMALKRFEVLLELDPRIRRLVVMGSGRPTPSVQRALATLSEAARTKSVEIRALAVGRSDEVKGLLAKLPSGPEDGVLILPNPDFDARAAEIGRLTADYRLVAALPWKQYVEAGGLFSYAPDLVALWRQASAYVDRILRGARPSDLPIEQPTKFELVINVKTARLLNLAVAPSLLVRADHVID